MPRRQRCWRWVTGSHGAKVKVFERVPGGPLYVGIPLAIGGYRRVSLGHTNREQAMKEACALAASRQAGHSEHGPLTVSAMFALYLASSAGKQSPPHAVVTQRAAELWTRWLGSGYRVDHIGPAQWEAFVRLRTTGEIDAKGRAVPAPETRERVGPRAVARDLKVLRAACRRATIERTPSGGFVLAADPTRGLAIPAEKNPRRPIYDATRVEALLNVADSVLMRIGWGKEARYERSHLRSLLRLASDTGRRISSILALRWADWYPDLGTHGKLRWRAEEDKLGRDWLAPITPEVRAELERVQRERMAVGEALIFPRPNDPTKPVTVDLACAWLERAERLAGLDSLPGGLWHPFRRKWATERKHMSPKDVAAVGGWVDTQTLQKCYQIADDETMEAVLLQPRRLHRLG
jgi:integrase